MPHRFARGLVSRLLVAAFALWLPAATGQGGKATCIAAASLAKTMAEAGSRPHLSCHGEAGSKKNCCCKGQDTLRAAACGCHDGETPFGTSAHDPMLASWLSIAAAPADDRSRPKSVTSAPGARDADAPDPPPPQAVSSFCA